MPAAELGRTEFLDANVLVYAFTTDDPQTVAAEALLIRGCCIGVQGLKEFASVAKRKLKMTWLEIEEALATIRAMCSQIVPFDLDITNPGSPLRRATGSPSMTA